MVLLIDHHAEGLLSIENQSAPGTLGGMLAADQMPFNEDLFIQRGQRVHRLREGVFHLPEGFHRWTDQLEHSDPFRFLRPTREGGLF